MESGAMNKNKNEEDEEIEANTSLMNKYMYVQWKPLKIFFFMFKLIGVNLDLNAKNKRVSIFTWIYFILLFPIPTFFLALQIYTVCIKSDSERTMISAAETEHYVLLSAMLVVALRHSQINELVSDSLNLLIQYSKNEKYINQAMIKAITLCAVIGILDFISETYLYLRYTLSLTIIGGPWYHNNLYFGIEMEVDRTIALVTNFNNAFRTFQVLCSHLFCALLLFIMFIINQSYRQLNENFKTTGKKENSSKMFMTDHLEMTKIVQRFNKVFTPAMLVVISMHMIDLVTTAYHTYSMFKYEASVGIRIHDLDFIIGRTIIFIKIFVEFMFMTKLGQEIQNHAQESISILLDANISNENDKPDIEKSLTTNLFTAKMISSPVTICANYFVVDYDLVKIVFSIAVAYFAFIEGFEKASKNLSKNCNTN